MDEHPASAESPTTEEACGLDASLSRWRAIYLPFSRHNIIHVHVYIDDLDAGSTSSWSLTLDHLELHRHVLIALTTSQTASSAISTERVKKGVSVKKVVIKLMGEQDSRNTL
jgi:hypothetical protein